MEHATIHNPILRGFNPDPAICRVGEDYYIAVSTFEWFPGVRIHHSRDLVHWRLLTAALTTTTQLDMKGVPCSCGIWAPCLSHDGKQFYLVYTIVQGISWPIVVTNNYLVTAPSITGPWSDPIPLNNSGFDPSLFHDDGGRSYLCNMYNGWVDGETAFSGIIMQEYSHPERRLIGDSRIIWRGTSLGVTEGPHLYKKDKWYYLVCAEGGTHFGHAVSVARSTSVWGPWETHPHNPIITSRDKPHLVLQKAGHGSLVHTTTGEWYMAHLVGRPIANPEFGDGVETHRDLMCILGRETALQKIVWTQGWPSCVHGSSDPAEQVPAPALPSSPWPAVDPRITFSPDTPLDMRLQTLREPPVAAWLSLQDNPGYLRLYGRNFFHCNFDQSLVGCRVESLYTIASTRMRFSPASPKQMAGLAAYYDTNAYYYLRMTADLQGRRVMGLLTSDNGKRTFWPQHECTLPECDAVFLRFVLEKEWIQFAWSIDGENWNACGPRLNATYLSDDAGWCNRFTGLFAALCCQDAEDRRTYADFSSLLVGSTQPT